MNAKSLAITGAAVGTLVVLGVLASNSPEFKYHATTVLIVLLGLISLSGVVAALILGRTDPTSTRAAERASGARTTARSGHYTGGRR